MSDWRKQHAEWRRKRDEVIKKFPPKWQKLLFKILDIQRLG